jgi:hypothetical protein
VNGEAIYGTSPSPFNIAGLTWRATVKPGKVYVHILNWPGRTLRLEGLESDLKKAYFLANHADVPFRKKGSALEFTLPAKAIDPYVSVMALEIGDEQPKVANGYRADQIPDKLDLYAWVARLRGEQIRYDFATQSATGFKHVEQANNSLAWYPYKSLDGTDGTYDVEVTYAADNNIAGSQFRVASEKRGAPAESTLDGTVEKTGGKFVTRKLPGKLTVKPDTELISFGLTGTDQSAPMKVQKITLTRSAQ